MHVDETVLAPLRARYGEPIPLRWEGEVSERELALIEGRPGSTRRHDVTFFIFNGPRLALIRKHHFGPGVWRPPGGGVKPGEDFVTGALREAREETGVEIALERYLVRTKALFSFEGEKIEWRTHVFSARTASEELAPLDTEEIAAARWGSVEELAGPLRQTLLATGRALWRYRVALHDAALAQLGPGP